MSTSGDGARYVRMTYEQRVALSGGVLADEFKDAYDDAPKPVRRRRCTTEGHGHASQETIRRCLVAVWIDERGDVPAEPCVFVDEFCIPAPKE